MSGVVAICGDPGFVNRAARQPAADWRNVQPREVQVGDSKVLGISGELEVDALVLVFALADPSCEDADGWDAPDKRRGIDAHDVGVGQPEAEQPEVFVAGGAWWMWSPTGWSWSWVCSWSVSGCSWLQASAAKMRVSKSVGFIGPPLGAFFEGEVSLLMGRRTRRRGCGCRFPVPRLFCDRWGIRRRFPTDLAGSKVFHELVVRLHIIDLVRWRPTIGCIWPYTHNLDVRAGGVHHDARR